MADRKDPYRKFRFKVEFNGTESGGFSEVSGFDASVDVVEYREGNETPITVRKLTGLAKYGNITLKWGVIDSTEMFNWMQTHIDGKVIERKTVTITALDEEKKPVAAWQVINAWPTKYTAPDFSATASEVAIETLELAHEGMTRVQ